ncbi:MAG: hypothetical protein KAH03_04180, partial [Cocleimonas sp.]|nr:hypothetical protein [Cocleimonas sp.]
MKAETLTLEADSKDTESIVLDDQESLLDIKDFPYAFAKRNKVVVTDFTEDAYSVSYGDKLTPATASEVQRFLSKAVSFQALNENDFNQLLARHYDQGDGARAMMDDLGDELDLNDVADSMPEPEDLLEAEDDAPIIRLINALLTQAIKENASDIHIET